MRDDNFPSGHGEQMMTDDNTYQMLTQASLHRRHRALLSPHPLGEIRNVDVWPGNVLPPRGRQAPGFGTRTARVHIPCWSAITWP